MAIVRTILHRLPLFATSCLLIACFLVGGHQGCDAFSPAAAQSFHAKATAKATATAPPSSLSAHPELVATITATIMDASSPVNDILSATSAVLADAQALDAAAATDAAISSVSPEATAATTESWRQYVPLIVSGVVIFDILLGSPLLNTVAAPLRQASMKDDTALKDFSDPTDEKAPEQPKGGLFRFLAGPEYDADADNERRRGERIDTTQVAQDAIDRARSTLELKKFLDESKSDWDKMKDVQKQLDQDMAKLDTDLQARQDELDRRGESK